MKKITCLLALLSMSLFSFGQISITNANMPSSGDTIRYSTALAAGINYDTTGNGISWDYSSLSPINQNIYQYKTAFSINPAYSLFFGLTAFGLKTADTLNVGIATLTDLYDFLKNTSGSFRAVGRGLEYQGIPIPSDYSDEDEIYQFPLQMSDYDSSTFSVSFSLATTLQLHQKGYRINNVVGWGSITTPYGTYDCLKMISTVYERDSLVVNSFGLPAFPRVTRQIKWLSTTEKIPVMEVNGNMIAGNFIPTDVRYRDAWIPCLSEAPSLDFTASATTGTVDDVFDFTNTSLCALTYLWTITPNTFAYVNGTGQTDAAPSVQFSASGLYSVQLNGINGSGFNSLLKSDYILIEPGAGLESNLNSKNAASVYPNPFKNSFRINSMEAIMNYSLRDLSGRLLSKEMVAPGISELNLNLNSFASGMYFLELQTSKGIQVLKLVQE